MFRELRVPIAGLIENMAFFTDPTGAVHHPFGQTQLESVRAYAGVRDEKIISGQNRYKYFRRPIIPFMNAQPPEVLFAPVEPEAPSALELPQPEPEPATKTVETQSDFRESETQNFLFIAKSTDLEVDNSDWEGKIVIEKDHFPKFDTLL